MQWEDKVRELNEMEEDQTIDFLKNCDDIYHNGETPLVSDYEYDKAKTLARTRFPNNPYFKTVGATPTGDKVTLPYVLGSLEKKKFDGSLNKWLRETDIKIVAISDKLDGCTIYVEYKDGKVVFAATRGNGYQGRDITEKAKLFCPKTIPVRESVCLKGEVLATTHNAHSLGYKKSRTFVAGVLNRDDMENVDALEVVFYQVLNKRFDTYTDSMTFIKNVCNLPVVDYATCHFTDIKVNPETMIAEYYQKRKEISVWDIDGLVISDWNSPNNSDDFYPTTACAFKVNEDAIKTVVSEIEWEIKRSGKLQPVVHIEPVEISGSTVTKATGFNVAFIRDNGINVGSEIGILLSGEIIPFIEVVYTEKEADIPSVCPSCGSELSESKTGIDLYCLNPECEGRMLYRLENFLLANGVEEVSSTTIRNLGINSFDELLDIDEFDISALEGFGASRASTIVNQIKKVYSTTPSNLLQSFGITGVGSTMSKMIVTHFDTFEDIFKASEEDFQEIEGIGEVVASKLVNELPLYYDLYKKLIEGGLSFKKKGISMKGLKITLTGASEIRRNDLIKMIEDHGGMVKGISKGVDYLFTNSPNSTTTKMRKAREYGITILDYDKLYEMLGVSVR